MKMIKGILQYILLTILKINLILMVTLKFTTYLLSKYGLVFRNWVNIIRIGNRWCFFITFIIFLNAYFIKRIISPFKRAAIIILSTIIIGILIFFAILDIGFSQRIERSINKGGEKIIAESRSFLGTTWVDFYIPVNQWVMKATDIPQERYEHGNNPYR
jgi:hypothetical protein